MPPQEPPRCTLQDRSVFRPLCLTLVDGIRSDFDVPLEQVSMARNAGSCHSPCVWPTPQNNSLRGTVPCVIAGPLAHRHGSAQVCRMHWTTIRRCRLSAAVAVAATMGIGQHTVGPRRATGSKCGLFPCGGQIGTDSSS
jgi:hypothetical protein